MSSRQPRDQTDLRVAAGLASGGLLLFFGGYWAIQIQDVAALLELAYGPGWWRGWWPG